MSNMALLILDFEEVSKIKNKIPLLNIFSDAYKGKGKDGIIFSGWFPVNENHNIFVNKEGFKYLGENKSGKKGLDLFSVKSPIYPFFEILKESDKTYKDFNTNYKSVKSSGKFAIIGVLEKDLTNIMNQPDYFKKICKEIREHLQGENAFTSCRVLGKPEAALLGLMNHNTAGVVNMCDEIFTLFGMKNVDLKNNTSPINTKNELIEILSY